MGAFKSGEWVERVKSLWEENVIISMDFFFIFCSIFLPSVEFRDTSMLLCSPLFPVKALSFDQAKYIRFPFCFLNA